MGENKLTESEQLVKSLGTKLATLSEKYESTCSKLKAESSLSQLKISELEESSRTINVFKCKLDKIESKEVEVKECKADIGNRSDFLKKLTMFRNTVSKKEDISLSNKCKNCLLLQEELSKLKEENFYQVGDDIDDLKRSLRAVEERCAFKDLRIDELIENVKTKETAISN